MLVAEDIDLHYGASRALRSAGLTARPGEITCVLGRNGVGKTSLLTVLMGLRRPSSGRIVFDGAEVTRRPAHERAALGFPYVPQGRDIFPRLTVEENLQTGFASLPAPERQVPERLFTYFPVLKEMLGRHGGDLSGGQQQQLAIARALVTRPRLLLLDEPTEGIQPSIIKLISDVIAALRDEHAMAIVLVEQYFEFAHALADRIVVMDRGAVVMEGHRNGLDEAAVRRHLTL